MSARFREVVWASLAAIGLGGWVWEVATRPQPSLLEPVVTRARATVDRERRLVDALATEARDVHAHLAECLDDSDQLIMKLDACATNEWVDRQLDTMEAEGEVCR